MEQILIKGRKILKGNDPSFKEVPCFDLSPGSQVISIGYLTGNNNTGGNMLDEFKQPVTYVGVYIDNNGEHYMAFKLNDGDVSGWTLYNPKVDIYLLYDIGDGKLFRPDLKIGKCWTLEPVFTCA